MRTPVSDRRTMGCRFRQSLAACAAGLTVLGLSACGASDGELTRKLDAKRYAAIQIVPLSEIRRAPARSPERLTLELWRAAQFRDARTAVELFGFSQDSARGAIFGIAFAALSSTALNTRPTIEAVHRSGRTAIVALNLSTREGIGEAGLRTRHRRTFLQLERARHRWRFSQATALALYKALQ